MVIVATPNDARLSSENKIFVDYNVAGACPSILPTLACNNEFSRKINHNFHNSQPFRLLSPLHPLDRLADIVNRFTLAHLDKAYSKKLTQEETFNVPTRLCSHGILSRRTSPKVMCLAAGSLVLAISEPIVNIPRVRGSLRDILFEHSAKTTATVSSLQQSMYSGHY